MRHKCPFTLLEIMICLALLALLASTLLIKAKPMIEQYQFEAAAKKLVRELNLSRHLAVTCRADIELTIKKKGNKLILVRFKEELVTFDSHFNHNIIIDHIPSFYIEDKEVGECTFFFTETGWIFPEVKKVSLRTKEKTYFIDLAQAPYFCLKKNLDSSLFKN
jgi:hypothetical protein